MSRNTGRCDGLHLVRFFIVGYGHARVVAGQQKKESCLFAFFLVAAEREIWEGGEAVFSLRSSEHVQLCDL